MTSLGNTGSLLDPLTHLSFLLERRGCPVGLGVQRTLGLLTELGSQLHCDS